MSAARDSAAHAPGGDLALIDAGGANLGSVRYALARIGAAPRLVALLRARGLDAALRASAAPLLGVCVGMQLLFKRSDEGDVECLGLLPGRVRRLPAAPALRIPHMGWNTLRRRPGLSGDAAALLDGIDDGAHAYFVHSFAHVVDAHAVDAQAVDAYAVDAHAIDAEDASRDVVLADSEHGVRFAAVVGQGRRFGAQFHPERSSAVGLRLLSNFLSLPA